MKVFLTGATGFIGSAIMRNLISAGHQVTGLVQNKENKEKVNAAGGTPILGDLLVPGPWKEAVQDHDVVISASSPFRITDKLSIDEAKRRGLAHTEMVTNLINAAAHVSKVQAVILTYHVTAFGSHGDSWVSEVMPVEPVGLAIPIAEGYWDIEKAARKAGVPTIEVFPGWAYGQGSWFSEYLVAGLMNDMPVLVGPGQNYKSLDPYRRPGGRIQAYPEQDAGRRAVLFRGFPSRKAKGFSLFGSQANSGNRSLLPADYTLFAKQYGEVLAQTLDSSVRVSNNKAKLELGFMPKFDNFCHGIPDILEKMGILPEKKELPKAAGF